MSRPTKKGLDYFPHDTDARGDIKIKALMAVHGPEGYCFYFSMLEEVFRVENGRINAGSEPIKAGLAKDMCISVKKFDEILATALEVGCFDKAIYEAEGVITSEGIKRRLDKVSHEREQERIRKENYINKKKDKYKEKRKTSGGKLPENETPCVIKKKYLDFVLLSDEEHEKLVTQFGEKGANDRISNLNSYGHQKPKKFKEYESHYHTILTWERKNGKGDDNGTHNGSTRPVKGASDFSTA